MMEGNQRARESRDHSDADYSGLNLDGVDFSHARITGANFKGSSLIGTDFEGSDLRESSFKDAILEGANFTAADLRDVDFTAADVSGANYSRAKLTDAIFVGANLTCSNMSHASLHRADFRKACTNGIFLAASDCTGANFTKADFSSFDFSGTYLLEVNFNEANLSRTDLSDQDLSKANLDGANLNSANLSKACLDSASLEGTTFQHTILVGSSFVGAHLSEVDFRGSDLRDTDFSKANLVGADFTGANLRNAILSNARLNRANFTATKLERADFSKANAEKATLTDAALNGADLTTTNLTEANLANANLERAFLLGSDLTKAILTGACIKDWSIDRATCLTDVVADFVYRDCLSSKCERESEFSDRYPSFGIFSRKEFSTLFQQAIETLDIVFTAGINWRVFFDAFQQILKEYAAQSIKIQALENKGNGAFIVRLEVSSDADSSAIKEHLKTLYEDKLLQVEEYYRDVLKDKEGDISFHRQQNVDLITIIGKLAEKPTMTSEVTQNFHAPVANAAGTNYGSMSALQNNYGSRAEDIARLFNVLRDQAQTLPNDHQQEALDLLNALETDIKKPQPDKGRISRWLKKLMITGSAIGAFTSSAANMSSDLNKFTSNINELAETIGIPAEIVQPSKTSEL